MNHLALFNGIGGFQLAAHWMGWNNVAHVEIDDKCNQVVKKYFPKSKCYTDIKQFNGKKYNGTIDIISGGFPCQPFSVAGKRKGKEDDRNLWPEMFRVIREVHPTWVVGENVANLTNFLEFEQTILDLESEGYEVQPFIIPAAAVGAWHKRDRVWIVAHTDSKRLPDWNTIDSKREISNIKKRNQNNRKVNRLGSNTGQTISNTNKDIHTRELDDREYTKTPKGSEGKNKQQKGWSENRKWLRVESCTGSEVVSNTTTKRLERSNTEGAKSTGGWIMQPLERDWWATEPDVGRVADGVPGRVDRLKQLGNAIVPKIAYEIFKAIDNYD